MLVLLHRANIWITTIFATTCDVREAACTCKSLAHPIIDYDNTVGTFPLAEGGARGGSLASGVPMREQRIDKHILNSVWSAFWIPPPPNFYPFSRVLLRMWLFPLCPVKKYPFPVQPFKTLGSTVAQMYIIRLSVCSHRLRVPTPQLQSCIRKQDILSFA